MTDEERARIFRANIKDNDCGVIAAMTLADVTYEEAEGAVILASQNSERGEYIPGVTGTWRENLWAAIELLTGGEMVEVEVPYNSTPSSFAMERPSGLFTVHVSKHVMALADGDLHNSRSFWGYPVEAIRELVLPSPD
jgi:hypothetical protein